MRSWGVVLGALALGSGAWLWAAPGDAEASWAQGCREIRTASDERRESASVSGDPTHRVAVIGDSYSQGSDLADPTMSWPSRLEGTVVVDGFGGSGFSVAASPCRGVAFPQRVARALATAPDLVVVQGGLNDVDVSPGAVRAGIRETLRRLEGHQVVVVGPPTAPRRAAGAARVDAVLAVAAAGADVAYVRTSSWRLEYLPDRLHLTPAGHEAFGDAVQGRIGELLDR